jgi:predicted enzyme related to lactoylglutathione lyase
MSERTSYTEGTPSWVDLGTPDLEAAKRFYGDLFGWTYESAGEAAGNYTIALRDGLPVAAVAPLMSPSQSPQWTTYFASDDADRTAARITEAGGRLGMDPMDVFDQGRMLFAFDPSGTGFGVWQGKAHIGARRVNEHGAMIWNELHTPDSETADQFYSTVFGLGTERLGDGLEFDYVTYQVGDQTVGGRNKLAADDTSGSPAGWLTYFAADDTDRVAAAVRAGGGTVLTEPRDSPYGRMAVLVDPWGATFAVIQTPAEEEASG